MIEILNNLYIGNLSDFKSANISDWSFVHATQTIHYELMGWDRKYKRPIKVHPNYIKLVQDNRFSLNWVDGKAELYDLTGVGTFNEILDFIDQWISQRGVLVHCDQGISRSPTVGLLYLAKRANKISNESFFDAKNEFFKIYPSYLPSGIGEYVSNNWHLIK